MRTDTRTTQYVTRRQAEGKNQREINRCLKRHIAREIYRLFTKPTPTPDGTQLHNRRTQAGIILTQAAHRLDTEPTLISRLERGLYHNHDLATDTSNGSTPDNRLAHDRSVIEASHFRRA